ncbi:MAG: MltA domain-containing protein [Acidobacteriota bacterium]|nr:MltA domain-containing protein [Acidobacteriota bacterium]
MSGGDLAPSSIEELRRRLVLWRFATLAAVVFALAAVAVLWLWARRLPVVPPTEPVAVEEREPELVLEAVAFSDLPGWPDSDPGLDDAVRALEASCRVFGVRGGDRPLGDLGVAGKVADWEPACLEAVKVAAAGASAARVFFEEFFFAAAVSDRDDAVGLFTGYFEPTLQGSRSRQAGFDTPLYLRPPELVDVDLGKFRDDLRGRRVAGTVGGGRLEPFADRDEIERGALAGRGLELLWVDNPVDAFFLQIQGSGRVELFEGGSVRVGYAGQNGHRYYAIGRELVERGELELKAVSMQSIRGWLEDNPAEAAAVMATNASYVFFRELQESGPVGSLGVTLIPERSVAIDKKFLPLGVPLWIDTTLPSESLASVDALAVTERGSDAEDAQVLPTSIQAAYRRLMVAHDTGGAIRGPVRADLFWGPGERAAEIAGRMRQEGRLWLLLPRTLEPMISFNASRSSAPGKQQSAE